MVKFVSASWQDIQLLLAVMSTTGEARDPAMPARLALMRIRHLANPRFSELVDYAISVDAARHRDAVRQNDQALLSGLVRRADAAISDDTLRRIAPMLFRYADDESMRELLEGAVTAVGDTLIFAACWCLAGIAIENARSRFGEPQ